MSWTRCMSQTEREPVMDELAAAASSRSEEAGTLLRGFSASSRYVLMFMAQHGDIPVTVEWLRRRLFRLPGEPRRDQRFVRRTMRRLRSEIEQIDPVPNRACLIRDRDGYHLNRDNPIVVALLVEVQTRVERNTLWSD